LPCFEKVNGMPAQFGDENQKPQRPLVYHPCECSCTLYDRGTRSHRIEKHNICSDRRKLLHRHHAIIGFTRYLEIGLHLQDGPEAATNQLLRINKKNANTHEAQTAD
jgi:hypothetical protein